MQCIACDAPDVSERPERTVYHGGKRTVISECGEQPFRMKSYTDFGRSRTVVSVDAEHPFRLMPNSPGS